MKKDNNGLKRKRRNGIWFNSTVNVENYAAAKAEKLQRIFENIIFYAIIIPIQLFQTAGVFVIAYINDAFVELSFFLVGFFFTRVFMGDTFHLSSTVCCTTCTWLIFFIVTSFIPSIYVSVFLSIILGALLAMYMNYIVVKDVCDAKEIR